MGFWAALWLRHLINNGHEVIGIDNMIGGVDGNVPELATYIKGDILDTELMKESMQDCEVVYHTASLPYEGLSVFSPTITATSIVSGTISTAVAAIDNNVRLLLTVVRWQVWKRKPSFTEDMVTQTLSILMD